MPARKPDDPAQYRRFIDIAKEVEADEDEGALDRAFDQLKPGMKKEPASATPKRSIPKRSSD